MCIVPTVDNTDSDYCQKITLLHATLLFWHHGSFAKRSYKKIYTTASVNYSYNAEVISSICSQHLTDSSILKSTVKV